MSSLATSSENKGPGSYLVWAIEGKPVSVHLNESVIRLMEHTVREPASHRRYEVGGLLLGRVRRVSADYFLVSVEDLHSIQSEHTRGASWYLSRRDRDVLSRKLDRFNRSSTDELRVVGWFRTHTRPGLYLDQYDFELFSNYFKDPAMVALLVRPATEEMPPQGGFFFWEGGDIRRAAPYKPFDFRSESLAGAMVVPARPVVPASIQTVAPAPPPHGAAAATQTVVTPVPRASVGRRPTWKQVALWTPVGLGVCAGLLWNPEPFKSRRALTEAASSTPSERTTFAAPDLAVPEEPVTTEAPVPQLAETRERTAPKQPVKKLLSAAARRDPRRPELITEAPTLPPVSSAIRTTGVPPLNFETPPLLASATVEPPRVSGLRRAVGSIPGLGFLKKKGQQKRSDFQPARALRQVRPPSPPELNDNVSVRVKLIVDDKGAVADASLLDRYADPQLGKAALEAAKSWRFEPARLSDTPVESELVVLFRFGPAASELNSRNGFQSGTRGLPE